AAVPGLTRGVADQPEVGFVNQRGSVERLAGLLLGEPLCGQLAQLVVDERQQLLGGLEVALLDGGQDSGDVAHADQSTSPKPPRPAGRAIAAERASRGRSWRREGDRRW